MPNTITTVFTSTPANQAVEAQHSGNPGVYVAGTQATPGGPWTVVHMGVSKTTTPPTVTGRLVGTSIVATIVSTGGILASGASANGNVFNNILDAPTGTSAIGTSTTAISLTVSNLANVTAYRWLVSDTSAGTYTQLIQQTTPGYSHSGLTAGTTKYYKVQYVGGGFYDDSPVSLAFSGTTSSATAAASILTPTTADYWYNNGIVRTGGTYPLHAASSQLRITLAGATTATINAVTSLGGTVLVTDGTTQVANFIPGSSPSDTVLTGLSGGTLIMTMGVEQRSYEVGPVQGQDVLKVTLPTGTAANFIPPANAPLQMAMLGDSISVGSGADIPQLHGWTSLFRNANRGSSLYGYGSAQGLVAGAQANWPALLAFLHSVLDGQAKQIIWWLYGSNDTMGAQGGGADTLANCTAAYSNFLANATAAFPAAKIITLTPIFRVGEATANQFGFTMAQLRASYVSASNSYPAVTIIDGTNILGAPDLVSDGAHPTTTGHQKLFNYTEPLLNSVLGNNVLLAPATSLSAPTWQLQPNTLNSNNVLSKTGGTQNTFKAGGVSQMVFGTTAGAGEKGRVHIDTTVVVRGTTKWGSAVIGINTQLPNWNSVDASNGPNAFTTVGPAFYYDDSKFGLIEYGAPLPFVTIPWTNYASNPDLDIVMTDSKLQFYVAGKLYYTANSFVMNFPLYLSAVLASFADATYPVSQARVTYQGVNLITPALTTFAGVQAYFQNTAVAANGNLTKTAGTLSYDACAALNHRIPAANAVGATLTANGVVAPTTLGAGSLFGFAPALPPAGVNTITNIKYAFYYDGNLTRVFSCPTPGTANLVYEGPFQAGDYSIAILSTGYSFRINGTEIKFFADTVADDQFIVSSLYQVGVSIIPPLQVTATAFVVI